MFIHEINMKHITTNYWFTFTIPITFHKHKLVTVFQVFPTCRFRTIAYEAFNTDACKRIYKNATQAWTILNACKMMVSTKQAAGPIESRMNNIALLLHEKPACFLFIYFFSACILLSRLSKFALMPSMFSLKRVWSWRKYTIYLHKRYNKLHHSIKLHRFNTLKRKKKAIPTVNFQKIFLKVILFLLIHSSGQELFGVQCSKCTLTTMKDFFFGL